MKNILFGISLIVITVGASGCVTARSNPSSAGAPTKQQKSFGTVAVGKINISQKMAKRIFSERSVQDIVTRNAYSVKKFKVIDWSRLSAVLFRRNLEWSDVVSDPKTRASINDVLLNDYFLVGTLSSYDERFEFASGAFSKSKRQITTVQLELFLKDALTNEVIASAHGTGKRSKALHHALGFGASGGTDGNLANESLNLAAKDGIRQIVSQLQARSHASTSE